MIKEAYVGFETAKLLKEKGFNIPCDGRYSIRTEDFHLDPTRKCSNGGLSEIAAPTHQMACGWLREEKNLCIYVFPHKDGYECFKWEAGICYCDDAVDATINACGHIFGKTYGEACEAALKYTLENLI